MVFLQDIARRDTLPPAVAFTLGVKLAGNGERYANELTALSRCRHRQWRDNSKTKALIGQVHDTARDPAGISLWKRSSAVPLGCHAEINKSALIGQVRDTARYPAGITPSVNGPLACCSGRDRGPTHCEPYTL